MRLRYILIVLAVLAAAYGALWYSLADSAEDVVQRRMQALRTAGIAAQSGKVDIGGFPYRLEVRLPDLEIARTRPPVSWRLSSPAVDIYTHPWTLGHLVASARDASASYGAVELEAPRVAASWREAAAARFLDADLGAVTLRLPWAPLRVERAQLHLRLASGDAEGEGLYAPERADVALSLTDLGLGALAQGAPAPVAEKLIVRFELHGAGLFPLSQESVAAWRDAGGTLELSEFSLAWGPVQLDGEGSLTLDERLRPLGALTLRIREPLPLIRYLRSQDALSAAQAERLVEKVRDLQAQAGPDQPVMLALTLQDGVAQLAGMPLGELGPVP